MFFIGGTYPKTEQYRSNTKEHCFHCNNDSYWILQKNRQVLNLFFIPVATLKTTYLYICPICGQGRNLDPDEFDEKMQQSQRIYLEDK